MQAAQGARGRGRGRRASRTATNPRSNNDDETNKRAGRKARFANNSGSASLGAATSSHRRKTPAAQVGFGDVQPRDILTPSNTSQPDGVLNETVTADAMPLQDQTWRDPTVEGNVTYRTRMGELYQTLKKNREKERRDAIRDGSLADPDKPRRLADAITPVGTCQDMCPEFERVERIVQLTVDGCEKIPSGSANGRDVPYEDHMVKRFRRSAAGYDEQLPSDIRPPAVLQRTLNYLLDEVVGGPQPLAKVHKFVWDRTRGIRNDFSIQQVTKAADLRIAIDCFERIARFHILALHQLSRPDQDNGEFDQHQEREQLNNTLLSLTYYYDDSRHKITSANEAEFRAYCIIFEIQDMRPDLEDRAQYWPRHILQDRRVQTALKLYAAAGTTTDYQGPLRPFTTYTTAQANYGRYWFIVASNAVSYLMACAAEIYFNYVRSMALRSILNAYKRRGGKQPEDWTLGDLAGALGFDEEDQARTFCEEHGFSIGQRADGQSFLDLASVSGRVPTDSAPRRKQVFSRKLVESKRLDRTLPAVINGLPAACGMVEAPGNSPLASSLLGPSISGGPDDVTAGPARGLEETFPSEGSESSGGPDNGSLFIEDPFEGSQGDLDSSMGDALPSPLAEPAVTPAGPPEIEGPSKDDARGKFLDELAEDVMVGPDGLLQQFIELSMGPTITSCVRWERTEEVRGRILGRKYLDLWREIAWRRGLLRRGRERRKTWAQAMRTLAADAARQRGATSKREAPLETSRSPSVQTSLPPPMSSVDDEDERLFAQMRSVREAMSEGISWYREESAKRSHTSSSSGQDARAAKRARTYISTPSRTEQRLARTYISTPSRTEQRLARTGGHGLATKEVIVKRNPVRDGKRPDYGHVRVKLEGNGNAPQGFATLGHGANRSMFTGRVGARPALQAQGNSIEDAIEL